MRGNDVTPEGVDDNYMSKPDTFGTGIKGTKTYYKQELDRALAHIKSLERHAEKDGELSKDQIKLMCRWFHYIMEDHVTMLGEKDYQLAMILFEQCGEKITDAIRRGAGAQPAIRAALAPGSGMVVVPAEPTEAMKIEGAKELLYAKSSASWVDCATKTYSAMLAAYQAAQTVQPATSGDET